MSRSTDLAGLLKVRGCCVFTWREWREMASDVGVRMVEVGPEHCGQCLLELQELQPPVRLIDRVDLERAAQALVENSRELAPRPKRAARRGRSK